jgi:lysine biosynthesis protein LysW
MVEEVTCPGCGAKVDVFNYPIGEIVYCKSCGATLELVGNRGLVTDAILHEDESEDYPE